MDEALRKIEKILAEQRQPSRIDPLLPRMTSVPKTDAAIDISHYGKVPAGEQPSAVVEEDLKVEAPPPPKPQPVDPAAKIGVGAREFKLDELSSEALGGEVNVDVASKIGTGGRVFKLDELGSDDSDYDPLMGNMLKPSNSRELSLDELSSGSQEE
jgi:hypothetical protein